MHDPLKNITVFSFANWPLRYVLYFWNIYLQGTLNVRMSIIVQIFDELQNLPLLSHVVCIIFINYTTVLILYQICPSTLLMIMIFVNLAH